MKPIIPEYTLIPRLPYTLYSTYVARDVFDIDTVNKTYFKEYVFDNTHIRCFVLNRYSKRIIQIDDMLRIYVYVLNRLASQCFKLNVIFGCSRKKKRMGKSTIGPMHVNSGFTSQDEYIFVYRNEEINKVLLHELIHYYKYDCVDIDLDNLGNAICKSFNIQSSVPVRLNESVTESLTTIIYASLYIIAEHGYPLTLHQFDIKFKEFMKVVTCHCLDQAANVWMHATQCKTYPSNTYLLQDSHVFEYYICKTSLLMKSNDFISWFMYEKHNTNMLTKLIFSSLQNPLFTSLMNAKLAVQTKCKPSLRMLHFDVTNDILSKLFKDYGYK
jgi:hypothetical protein